jgi:hypothetical protein
MRYLEITVAAVFFAMGVRSLVYWIRRPFEGGDTTDQVLFSLFVTGRVATWFAFGGLFLIYAWVGTRGQAFLDDVADFSWYLLVIVVLSAMQFVTTFLLGRRTPNG